MEHCKSVQQNERPVQTIGGYNFHLFLFSWFQPPSPRRPPPPPLVLGSPHHLIRHYKQSLYHISFLLLWDTKPIHQSITLLTSQRNLSSSFAIVVRTNFHCTSGIVATHFGYTSNETSNSLRTRGFLP